MTFEESSYVAVIILLAQVCKLLGFPKKYIPALNLVLGVAISFILYSVSRDSLFKGLLFGAGASGIFDFGKKTLSEQTQDSLLNGTQEEDADPIDLAEQPAEPTQDTAETEEDEEVPTIIARGL